MHIVTKIINTIKDGHRFLFHWKFQHFLEEHNELYKDVLLLCCEIRWLNVEKSLEKLL